MAQHPHLLTPASGSGFTLSMVTSGMPPDVVADVPYRSGANAPARCTLDLHLPDHSPNAPLLVWFHGGSLIEGNKTDETNLRIAEGLREQGLGVAMVNYRQSPGVRFPTYVEDAAAAIAWAVGHAESHGLDPGKIFVGGHSAGGYLALMATLDPARLAAAGIQSKDISGIISISAQTLTHSTVLKERGEADASAHPICVDRSAPLFFAHGTVPPILLLSAENDIPARTEENQLLAALLRRNPANLVMFAIINERDHISIIEKSANPSDPVARAIKAFLSLTAAAAKSP